MAMPKKLRIRYRLDHQGGHIHIAMFAGMVPDLRGNYTLGMAGVFTLREEEFDLWRTTVENAKNPDVVVEFVDR
jgi:hypothetical protein